MALIGTGVLLRPFSPRERRRRRPRSHGRQGRPVRARLLDQGGVREGLPGHLAGGTGLPGWNQYNSLRGNGDFTGDGKADLLARSSSTGDLYLYKGTGKSGTDAFSARVKVRSAWTGYNAFDAVGDVSGDGRADFLARTPGGTLYLYKGTGKATSEIFATRVSVGTGFQQYDIFG